MNRTLLLFVFIISILTSCTTTMTTRLVYQPMDDSIEMGKFLDAASAVLIENGFDIAMINMSYGIVNTGWRPIASGADTASTILSAFGDGPSQSYSRTLSVQIQRKEYSYIVIPKLKRIKQSVFGGQEDIEYPDQNSDEGKLVVKIIKRINELLRIKNDFSWEKNEIKARE